MDPSIPVEPRAPYPAPPPFWKYFTTANLERFHTLSSTNALPTSLPIELTYLRPPPPPPSHLTHYTTFTTPQPLSTTTPLLPTPDQLLFDPSRPVRHAALLTKLTKSLLLNFLELTTILRNNPKESAAKVDDLRKLVVNTHAVLNMYRPHQARESVREMLEERLEAGRREIDECERVKGEVREFLDEVEAWKEGGQVGEVEGEGRKGKEGAGEDEEVEQVRRLWRIVHEIADE